MVFNKIKRALSREETADDSYLEIDLEKEERQSKVIVKFFVLKNYEEVNDILAALREGYIISVIDIRSLRQRDSIELKRAIAKIKKTVDVLEGSIAGFGENIVIATPSFATIHKEVAKQKEESRNKFD